MTKLKIKKYRNLISKVNQMLWCSEECVVFIFKSNILIVGEEKFQARLAFKSGFAISEIDGLRIITD